MGSWGHVRQFITGRSEGSALPLSLPGSWDEVTLHKGNWCLSLQKLAEGKQALFPLPRAPHCSQGVWAPHDANKSVPSHPQPGKLI